MAHAIGVVIPKYRVYNDIDIIMEIDFRRSNTGFGIWDLPQESSTKEKIWDFGTKLGLFWDHFHTLLGLFVVIFIKMPQNLQKANKALKTV